MSLSLERDYALDVLHLEVVACRLIFRSELFYNRTLCESHIIFISRENLVGVLLGGLLDHCKQRRLHFLAVDDECSAENLVAAMLRVDLCETEYFRVCQRTAQFLLYLMEIFNLLSRQSQTLLLVVFLDVIHTLDWLRLVVDGEDVLVQPLIHALKHGVMVGIFRVNGEVLLNTRNAVEAHILSYLYGIRTPWSNHFAAWAHEEALDSLTLNESGTAVKPTQFIDLIL